MKTNRGKAWLGLALVVMLVGCIGFNYYRTKEQEKHMIRVPVSPTSFALVPKPTNTVEDLRKITASTRLQEMTEAQRIEFTNKFNLKLKPAMDRWCKAYEGHLPFNAEDVTIDKFHSVVALSNYAFMVNSNTVVITERPKYTRVSYVALGKALITMNSLPKEGTMPDLSMPVKREEVMRMVLAESGEEYKPHQVVLTPTGASGALGGGVNVTVNQILIGGGVSLSNTSYEMVFGPDGKLVYYDVGPLF